MPNTYAHFRFGQDVLKKTGNNACKIIKSNMDIFNIGVHGPDILAFYNPLFKNYLKELGSKEHAAPVLELLSYAGGIIHKQNAPEPYLAYMYGVICHFALDGYCHGYVNSRKAQTGIGHNLMEAEFDRMLMQKDGYDPFKFRPADSLTPTKKYAEIISQVSPKVEPEEVFKSIKGMRKWCNFYVAPTMVSRAFIYTSLFVSGNYGSKNGMIIKHKPNLACDVSNKELLRLYDKAIMAAVILIDEYYDNVFNNKPYRRICEYCFSPQVLIENELDEALGLFINT